MSDQLPAGFVLDEQEAQGAAQTSPDWTVGWATTFGYRDAQDNGRGAWGTPTNNPGVVGVSLPRAVLRQMFGDENAAAGKLVEVHNPATGRTIKAPIVDKGPADWVTARQGATIDLTHGANQALGGTGKTPMQWRMVDGQIQMPDKVSEIDWTAPPEVVAQRSNVPADVAPPQDPDALPPGFVLDADPGALPPGFVLDPDPAGLSFWEKMKGRWNRGSQQAADDQLSYRAMTGELPWESVKDQLRPAAGGQELKGGNLASEGLLSAVEMLPAMVEGLFSGVRMGAGAAAAGAGAALVGGQMGPQAALPEEIVTVPGAAAAGWTVGQTYGASQYWYKQGAGNLYAELRDEGIPHNIAQPVSAAFGLPYAAVEFVQVSKLVPGMKRGAGRIIAEGIKRRLARVGLNTVKTYGEQIAQETTQELLQIGSESFAEWASGVKAPEGKQDAGSRILDTIKQTAISVPFLLGPSVAVDTVKATRSPEGPVENAPAGQGAAELPPGFVLDAAPADLGGVQVAPGAVPLEAEAGLYGEGETRGTEKMQPPPLPPSENSGAARDSLGGVDFTDKLQPAVLDRKWMEGNFTDGDGVVDTNGASAEAAKLASQTLDDGGEVKIKRDGKEIAIRSIANGMFVDDQGRQWGTSAMLFPRKGSDDGIYLSPALREAETAGLKMSKPVPGITLQEVGADFPVDDVAPRLTDVQAVTGKEADYAERTLLNFPEKVRAADGSEILLQNPEQGRLPYRARHLITSDNMVSESKLQWLPMVPDTLRNAAVRLVDEKSGNRIYVRSYKGGVKHMVVVRPNGTVAMQRPFRGKLTTQFAEGSNRQQSMKIDWARPEQRTLPPTTAQPPADNGVAHDSRRRLDAGDSEPRASLPVKEAAGDGLPEGFVLDPAPQRPDGWTAASDLAARIKERMPNGPEIEVVRNADELRDRYDGETHASMTEGKAEAFYDPQSDRATVILDHARPMDGETMEHYLTRKILHEAAGHGGLIRLFDGGPLEAEYGRMMVGAYRYLRGQDFGADWGAKHGYRTMAQLAKGYGYDLSKPEGILGATEEHLARLSEEPVTPKWYDGIVAAITRWIRSMGHDVWTESDTRQLLAQARKAVGISRNAIGPKGELKFSQVIDEAAEEPVKKRKFIESVQNAQAVAPEVRDRVQGVYTPVSNAETVEQARAWINGEGVDGALAKLLTVDEPTARDYAAGIDLMGRLQAAGRFEDEVAVAQHIAEQSTDQGRAIQALSILAKLSAEGIQVYAARTIQRVVKDNPRLKRLYGQLSELRDKLRAANKQLASMALLGATRRGTQEKVQDRLHRLLIANKGSLWGRYKDQAISELESKLLPGAPGQPAHLQEFTSRLTRMLKDRLAEPELAGQPPARPQLTEAQAIGEAIRNFDKYRDVWTEAQAAVRERFRDNPEALQSLDGFLGQILDEPFSPASVDRAVKQELQRMNISMREALVQSAGTKEALRARLEQVILDGAGVTKDEAAALARSVHEAFDKQQQAERGKLLAQMTKLRNDRLPKSKLQRLMELNNAGALDDSRFFAALSKGYGIPAWTPELSAKVQGLQRDYERATDANLKLAKAAQMFDAIHELMPVDVWSKIRALQNIAMLLNPKTVIRNLGGNVIMFAADVTADAVTMTAVDPFVSIFTGQRTRRSVEIGARLAGLTQPVKDYWAGYSFAKEAGATKAASMAEGVKTVLTLARMSSRGKWDISQMNSGESRTFSSLGGRMLEDALAVALSVGDRSFHQAAFQASIARQLKLAEARGESMVAPSQEMVAEAMGDAARAVFQDPNFVSEALRKIGQAMNLASTLGRTDRYGIGAVVLPFSQVPGAIAMRGVEWSPLGFIRTAYEGLRPALGRDFDQKAFTDSFSRAILGTGGLALGLYLYRLGVATALDDDDKDLNAMRKASGWGQFLINVSALKRAIVTGNWWTRQQPQAGDVTINYDWVQPNAMALAMGAEIGHQQDIRARTPESQLPQMPGLLLDAASGAKASMLTLESQPLLTGLAQYARSVGQDGVISGTAEQVLAAPGMFIPTFISQANQLIDNQVRETRAGSPLDRAVAQIEARIPGLAQKYPPKYDVFGEAQERYGYGGNSLFNVLVNPAFLGQVKTSPVIGEINRVFAMTGEKAIIPNRAPVKLQLAGQQVELTNQQISDYQHLAGTLTMAYYARLAASPEYAAAPVGAKAQVMAKGLEAIGTVTKLQILRGNLDLVNALREQAQAAQGDKARLMGVQ